VSDRPDDGDTAARLTELELRYTLQQELLRQLNDVLVEQSRELDSLRRELERLKSRLSDGPGPLDPDERPPHY
jgi:uncharacterized coiled-coil protein SlyX